MGNYIVFDTPDKSDNIVDSLSVSSLVSIYTKYRSIGYFDIRKYEEKN